MGGLKTALEIYERLEMYAEVALCLAATDREAEAVKLLEDMVFDSKHGDGDGDGDGETIKSPPPADAPRLLCILADITSSSPRYYDLSWTVSGKRYARAQRSLGRHYTRVKDFRAAEEAYTLALQISRLDRQSRFALGCVQLELEEWMGAVESFTRCVQMDDGDAEAWSNLAVALLRLPAPVEAAETEVETETEEEGESAIDDTEDSDATETTETTKKPDPHANTYAALRALRRAATLKRDDARIWDNYLTVAARIPPSAGTPWAEILQALSRIIELRGKKEGEGCVDVSVLGMLVEFFTKGFEYPSSTNEEKDTENKGTDDTTTTTTTTDGEEEKEPRRLPHLLSTFFTLIDTQILPLATSNPRLYTLLSRVSTFRRRPALALTQAETSWRLTLTSISLAEEFDNLPEERWDEVVDKTVWMMGLYKELGPLERERTGGPVEEKWRFKSRSAGRRVLGRAKGWAGSPGYLKLKDAIDELKE
jgi:tetratricopeptide (TPR) repeat protein